MASDNEFNLLTGYEKELNGFIIKMHELLNKESLNNEEKKVEIFKMYDLALWRCHPHEVITEIESYILGHQSQFVSVFRRYMQGEHFDVEMDYVYMLLNKLNPDAIGLIKDEWIKKITNNCNSSEAFIDMVKIIYRNCNDYKGRLTEILEKEQERILPCIDNDEAKKYFEELKCLKDSMSK